MKAENIEVWNQKTNEEWELFEKYNEELTNWSDRHIVVEVLNLLTKKQWKKLLEKLRKGYTR